MESINIDYRIDDLVKRLKNGWNIHKDVYDGLLSCNIAYISKPHTSSVAKISVEYYTPIFSSDRILKFLRVATTIADIRGRKLVWSDDINRAVKLYNN